MNTSPTVTIDDDTFDLSMTFDENYGELPTIVLGAVKRYNISPADFDLIMTLASDWDDVYSHIVRNSQSGHYNPGWPVTL